MQAIQRIMTSLDREKHILACRVREEANGENPDRHEPWYWQMIGDSAAVHTNRVHDPDTGFCEFLRDTSAWVLAVAERRGW